MALFLFFARIVLAYVYAAMFSVSVSMTLSATLWGSGWTYLALLGGLALSTFTFYLVLFVGAFTFYAAR